MKASARNGEPFKLAILDEQMPEMSGLELAHCIQKDAQLSETPLIMLSSSGLAVNSPDMKKAGIKFCHSKPVRQLELRQSIAKFLSYLPDCKPMGSELEKPVQKSGAPAGTRILVAEDNPVNQEVILSILHLFGCKTDLADNGRKALEAWEENPYDLILMDCQMPEMDGYEVTGAIRRMEQGKGVHVPIVALTAHALKGDREKCLAAGMDDFLSKLFKRQQLLDILQKWIDVEKTPNPETPANPECPEASIIDFNALDNIRSLESPDNPGILGRVIEIYLQEAPEIIRLLRRAVSAEDAETVRQKAHYLKSSSANLGASMLAELCKDLEFMGKNVTLEKAGMILGKIEASFRQIKTVLQEQVKGQHKDSKYAFGKQFERP